MATKNRKPGRPTGSKTKERDEAEAPASKCRACGSTDRAPYSKKDVQHYDGQQIIRRWTHCLECGQHRVDITREPS